MKQIQLEKMNRYIKTVLAYTLCVYYYLKTISGFVILFFTKNHTHNFWHVRRRLVPPRCINLNENTRFGDTKFVEVNVSSRLFNYDSLTQLFFYATWINWKKNCFDGNFRTFDCTMWRRVIAARSWLSSFMDSQNFGE